VSLFEHFRSSLMLTRNDKDDFAEKLMLDFPCLAPSDKPFGYIAFCLLESNLELLKNDAIQSIDLELERIHKKFVVTIKSSNVGRYRLNHFFVFVLVYPVCCSDEENVLIERYSGYVQDFIAIIESDFCISLSVAVSPVFKSLSECEAAILVDIRESIFLHMYRLSELKRQRNSLLTRIWR